MIAHLPPRDSQRGGILFKLLCALMILAILATLYLLRRPILRAAGNFWVVDEAPVPADALIILGDDNLLAERAARAAEMYHARWAPRIVASGRWLRPYASVADLMHRDLLQRGVPEKDIVRFPHSATNTREEAAALRTLIREQGWSTVLVVTSNSHTRRSRYLFRNTLDSKTQFRFISARDSAYDPDSWWEHRSGWKVFLYEFLGSIVAVWEVNLPEPPRVPAAPGASPPPTSDLPAHSPHPATSRFGCLAA